jgi:hypothetical protein
LSQLGAAPPALAQPPAEGPYAAPPPPPQQQQQQHFDNQQQQQQQQPPPTAQEQAVAGGSRGPPFLPQAVHVSSAARCPFCPELNVDTQLRPCGHLFHGRCV